MACVNVKSKDFKDLANKYKVSNGTLELAINMYLDLNSLDDYNPNGFNFISYLNDYLKLGNTNTYSSLKDVGNAIKIWDKIKPRFELDLSLEEVKELSDLYGPVFGPENIIIYETNLGTHRIRVAKPVLESLNGKEGVSELFESNPELANIGTQQQYSQYLDTIFPDSKVRDIIYRRSPRANVERFHKRERIEGADQPGISSITKEYINRIKDFGENLYAILVDIKNPYTTSIDYDLLEKGEGTPENGYDGIISNGGEINVYEPEQIHILGSKQDIEGFKLFVKKLDGSNSNLESSLGTSLLYQAVNNDFREILQKLHKINKTPLGVGSDKNIRHLLKRDGIPNEVIEGLISIINKNKLLRNVSFGNIFSSYIKLINKDSNDNYYEHILKPINLKLEELILDYFKPYNITLLVLDNLKDRFGVDSTGAYDILNKIVYLAKNRNALTLPEEYGHAFVELMGSVPSKNLSKLERNMSEIYSFLHESVEDWSGYSRVFEDYKDTYTKADGSPDINKIKKEAIGLAIGMALVELFEESEGKSKSYFSKIFDFIKAIYDKFSNVDFIAFESQVNSIAKDIIEKNYSKLNKVKNTENYNLLDYIETIQNLNKIDGGKALSFMLYFSELGNIITGSLAYRRQGTVYRPKIDALHDIDMVVDWGIHGIDLSSLEVLLLLKMDRSKGSSRGNILNFIKDQDYFKKVSEKYPKMKYIAGYGDNNRSRITVNAVYSENESLSERFSLLTGDYASRLNQFTAEERSLIYLFDFFLKSNGESTEYIRDEDYQLNLAHHNYSFSEKLNLMGRPKDAYDYLNWKAFNPLLNLVEELVSLNMMFQRKQEATPGLNNNTISYTPTGKGTQTYKIEGSKIINSSGKEVFKEDSKDRRKVFANYAVKQGRAVVVNFKGVDYVVNKEHKIISTKSGDFVFAKPTNSIGIEIREEADKKFNNLKSATNAGSQSSTPQQKQLVQQVKEAPTAKDAPSLEKSKAVVDKIINDSKKRIVFDEKTHTYTVDGKKADYSVTQWLRGNKKVDMGLWELPSSLIGTTADVIVRDFFEGSLKSLYPNMSKDDLQGLKDDLEKLVLYFDSKFGKGKYGIVTQEFPIASIINTIDANGKPVKKLIAGTMDMLLYDDKGNFYIYDMKTSRSGILGSKKSGYTKQLNAYKSILEASYPELRDKIKELSLIHMSVTYPDPNESEVIYEQGDKALGEDPTQLYLNGYDIESSEDYAAPRLDFDEDITLALISLKNISFDDEFESLPKKDKDAMEEEVGSKKFVYTKFGDSPRDKLLNVIFDSNLIPAQERSFLANSVMTLTSVIVSHLQEHKAANEKYFSDGRFEDIDFTTKTRREIIELVDINNLFNIVKEQYFNTENLDIDDESILTKLDLIYDNWNGLIRVGKNKLITLENVTIDGRIFHENIEQDLGDPNLADENDSGNLEEKVREHWQIGQRLLSAKGNLSLLIRRTFDRLPVLDENGDQVLDEYGYGMPLYVDSDIAVNSILKWVNTSRDIESMEAVLMDMAKSFPWINSVLEKIKEEPFRSLFYTNFRKDFTKYSVINVEYDDNGNRTYVTHVVNTKGASKVILEEIVSAFREGVMSNLIKSPSNSIDGAGRVNEKEIIKLDKIRKDIYDDLIKAGKTSKAEFQKTLENSIPAITDLLVQLGIHTNEKTIKAALTKDLLRVNYLLTSNISAILLNAYHLLNTLDSNKEEVSYNPVAKGQEGNIYGNYKNIVNVLADYIQDNIESSTFENGKLYYSFTTPSYILNMVNSLSDAVGDQEKFDNYLEDNYGSFKWFKTGDSWNNEWLRLLATDVKKRAQFEHKVQLSFESRKGNKVPYEKLSKLGYTTSMMTEFFYDTKKNYAWYRVPIMSDKPSAEFIKFVRYHTGYKDKISSGMKNVFDQELMRIKTVLERAVAIIENNTRVEDIKFYDAHKIMKDNPVLIAKLQSQRDTRKVTEKNRITIDDIVKNDLLVFSGTGAEFKFLSAFNSNLIAKDEIGLMIAEKLNINPSINEPKLTKLFNLLLKSYMADIFVSEKENWKALGVYDTEVIKKNDKEVTLLKYVSHLGKNELLLDSNLEEYLWNDMFATINIIQLTTTDLAYYKNVEDFQKRFAQVHAPAMKMNTSAIDRNGVRYSDGTERSMSIRDSEIVSKIIPLIKSVLYNKVGLGLMTRFYADSILAQYGYSNTPDGKFVKSKTEDGKEIFLKSNTINVTDGQGYSSPTSYRKKMGMMGKWSNQMEDAYEKIRSGNWNGEDLDVVWQPLKPFVYSQLRKTSYSNTMSELKVPMLFKNSEYLLVMADAILEGAGEVNNLSAIYKFMEESAYTDGKYNGKGIDTVLFESAVKTSLMGAVDINNAKSNQEIIDILKKAAYNKEGGYNDLVVHNIAFDDYGIQLEVPAHLMGALLMGSLMRILAISDMSADTTFDVAGKKLSSKELNLEYQNLIAENVNDSFNQLIEELNLLGNKYEKNKALSELLLDAIKNDTKYGPDMEYALTLKDGEFNIPLSDPIHSIKIQLLLNSIIKSRVNKQTISGGPVVQVTAFSKDLKIIWKGKDGNILMNSEEWKALPKDLKKHNSFEKYLSENKASVAYYEVYMPIPSLSMEKAITKADGTLMSIEEALKAKVINEEQLKAIGYRIPTEDKYSLAPMKIKGFLPKSAGEGIMMPLEITLISGSDFDIDKLYIILKDFNPSGEKTNYKALKNDLLKDNDIKELLKKDGVNVSRNKNISDALSVIFDLIEAGTDFSQGSPEMYVLDYINNNKLKYVKHYFNEYNDLKRREGRNNRIFDLQWAVLTNEDTADKMFNPGSFDILKKIARVVNIAKNPNNEYTYDLLSSMTLDLLDELVDLSSGKDILLSSTLVYLHSQNMTAGSLIGIFANNNTAHAFTAMQDIDVTIEDPFYFDGVLVSNESNNKLDKLLANDNMTLISKTIAGYLAASVDAVKDPVLNFLNLNTFTTNVAMLLTRMGFDADSVGLFLTQPLIEKVTNEYFKRSNEGYTSIDSVINDELEVLKTRYNVSPEIEDLKSNKFTKEDMFNHIQNRAKGNISNDSIAYQALALLLFLLLAGKGLHLNTLTFLTKFNSVSNAVGPTIADTLVMELRYLNFLDLMDSITVEHPFSENAVDIIENSPILKSFYENTVGKNGASKLIFLDHFPHYTSTFGLIMSRLKDSIKGNLDSKLINKLISEFMLYKMTIANQGEFLDTPIFDTSPAQRTKYMNNFVKHFLNKTRDINDNDLINVISVKSKDKKNPVSTLLIKTGGYSINALEKIKDAWTNLISNPNTHERGLELFFYNLMRNGFNFSPKTFLHLASSAVKMNIPGYIESLRNVEFNNWASNADEFIIFFLRNHSEDARLVPKLRNEKLKIKRFRGVDGKNKYTFTYNPNSKELQDIRLESGNEFSKFMWFEDKLFMYESNLNNTVTYSESSPLGNTNNFLEYNANEVASEMNSVLKNPVEFPVQGENDGTPSNGTVQGASFNLTPSEKRILERTLTAELISSLNILLGLDKNNAVIKMLQEKYNFETSERIKGQIKKIINKLC